MTDLNTPLATFAKRLTDPDDLGWAVSAEVRNIARNLLCHLPEPHDRWVYIAGPMTGLRGYNHPAFLEADDALRAAGYVPVNPARNGLRAESKWHHHLRRDIGLLLACAGVALLPGWESSRGARLEVSIADALGMRVCGVADWA